MSVSSLNELLDRAPAAADAEALIDGTQRLTWAAYRDRVARIAAVLQELGVERGDRVGVHLPKSVDSFAAVHGVLRAGAAVVPLDPMAPPANTATVVGEAGVEVAVSAATGDVLATLAAQTPLRAVVRLGREDEPVDGLDTRLRTDIDAAEPASAVVTGPDDLAYVMFTSGSTGRPKGISHTHRSALAYARCAATTYELTAADRLANIAPLHFDQSTFELYAAPLVGAAVLVVPDPVLRFPASLGKLIESERITVWYSVPFLADQLVRRGGIDDKDLSALRWILYGGEAYDPASLAELMRAIPSASVSNVYGPAEVNQCTVFDLHEPPTGDEPIPIGGAWQAATLLVVDTDDVPVEPGEPGQLLVATETMMTGYWERPDLDERAFVDRDGLRWYRTGDLVQARADGALVFLGRADNQVKVRGHRIELEAVEQVLAAQPGVEACAAIVVRPETGEDHLVAVVSPASAADDVLAGAAAALPRYAVPQRAVGMDRLARTGTGKVDRNAVARALAEQD
ncbi:MAG: amino acid adenylation domain-containing protein [Actinomycetota bacterium]